MFSRTMAGWAGMLLLPAVSLASPYDGKPKILLHLTHPTTKGILCDRGLLTDCRDAVVNGDLYPNGKSYFLYLEVARGNVNSIAGLELSVDYDGATGSGVDVFGWTYCVQAHYEAGTWPQPGSSNLLVWRSDTDCQRGEVAIAGYFYLAAYTPGVFRVLPRIVSGKAAIGACNGAETTLAARDLGRVAFSSGATTPGCNPCVEDCTTASPRGNPIKPEVIPVQATTWGGIKTLFGT